MSNDNVAIVLEQFEATNRRDFARPMADWADDIELVAAASDFRSGAYHGRDAVGEWFGEWFRMFREIHFDPLEVAAHGDSVALAMRHRVRGRSSGIAITEDFFYEYRVRDGKIVRVEFHESWREALEAVKARAGAT